MCTVLESEIITLFLSQNYDSYISRQRLNSFKTLTILSIIWSSSPLKPNDIVKRYPFPYPAIKTFKQTF